jgi:hypothetical protein
VRRQSNSASDPTCKASRQQFRRRSIASVDFATVTALPHRGQQVCLHSGVTIPVGASATAFRVSASASLSSGVSAVHAAWFRHPGRRVCRIDPSPSGLPRSAPPDIAGAIQASAGLLSPKSKAPWSTFGPPRPLLIEINARRLATARVGSRSRRFFALLKVTALPLKLLRAERDGARSVIPGAASSIRAPGAGRALRCAGAPRPPPPTAE